MAARLAVVPDIFLPDGTAQPGVPPLLPSPAARAALNRLRDRRLSVWIEVKKIAEDAVRGNRAFTPAEQARWDMLHAELTELDNRIKALA